MLCCDNQSNHVFLNGQTEMRCFGSVLIGSCPDLQLWWNRGPDLWTCHQPLSYVRDFVSPSISWLPCALIFSLLSLAWWLSLQWWLWSMQLTRRTFFSHSNTSTIYSWPVKMVDSILVPFSCQAPQKLPTLSPTAEQTLIVALFYCQPLCCPFFCSLCVPLSFPFCWTCSSAFHL